MAKISASLGLGLLFLISIFIFTVSLKLEAVRYEVVEDYGQYVEERFERIHEVFPRNVPPESPGDSSQPTTGPVDKKLTTSTATEQAKSTSRPFVIPSGPSTSSYTGSPLNSTIKPEATAVPTRINITEDNHRYYKSRYYPFGTRWWFNLDDGGEVELHDKLSQNLQYSETIRISFMFPYYGHLINDVTITNRGYVFLGEVVHKFNASAQYVAPLMADFTTINKTKIRFVDTGDRFTVEWANLRFQNHEVGEFSFQCSILKNGTIVFAYKNIPVPVVELKSDSFPVRVGLSDSYLRRYIRRGLYFIHGRLYTFVIYNVYYKYHTVDLPMSNVKGGSAFVITPLPNCVIFDTCDSCANSKTSFSCAWCPWLERCSDGVDRHRHEWLLFDCPKNNITTCEAFKQKKIANKTIELKKGDKINGTLESKGQLEKTNKTLENKEQQNRNKTLKYKGQEKGNKTLDYKGQKEANKTLESKEELEKANKTLESKNSKKSNRTLILSKEEKVNKTLQSNEQENANKTFESKKPNITNEKFDIKEFNRSNEQPNVKGNHQPKSNKQSSRAVNAGKIFLIVLFVAVMSGVICWLVYAYRHPQSKSGRFLIRHRNPKKWFRNSSGDNGTNGGKVHFKTSSYQMR